MRPPGADRSCYLQAAAGARRALLLGSGGGAVACRLSEGCQRDLRVPTADPSCAQAAAGARYPVLLGNGGGDAACGLSEDETSWRRSPT